MSALFHAQNQQRKRKRKAEQRAEKERHEIELRRSNPAAFAQPDFARADAGAFEDASPEMEEQETLLDNPALEWRTRKLVLGLILLPVCVIAAVTLVELFFRATVDGKFWKTEGFWFFAFGGALWMVMGLARVRPAWLYVFAHEFTHAITARLSGGKVHKIHIGEDGGYIETDKTNWLITLSPYLVPLYTVVIFALYGLLSIFVDMQQPVFFTLPVLEKTLWLKGVWAVYFLVGLTLCFHLTFTVEVLHTEQSDLRQNGEFFSMMLIFVVNLALIGALFIAASPTVSWMDVWNDAVKIVDNVWRWGAEVVAGLKARI